MTKEKLFEYLAEYGGTIENTASLDEMNIRQAQASGRMWVDENSLGYVWMPPNEFPTTEQAVENFDKWFPLEIEMPEHLKNPDFLFEKLHEKKYCHIPTMEEEGRWLEEYRNSLRFKKPTDKQIIDAAVLFNDGILDAKKLSDMVALCQFIIDRLYENGDMLIPCSKEAQAKTNTNDNVAE